MIGQMRVLLRVKEMKQDQAFRTMQAKRQQVAAAQEATAKAVEVVVESARTLATREDAIYADIMGQVIDLAALDETRGRVVDLEKSHSRLEDLRERAVHIEHRLDLELETTTGVYRAARKVRDKYVVITDDMQEKLAVDVEYREEIEVEDLFSRAARGPQ